MKAKIPHPLWASHLRSFSDVHRGWLVKLDGLLGGDSGELPLEGLELTPRGVSVRLGKGRFTQVIADPIAIEELKRDDGAIEALLIRDREDQQWRIAFHSVVAPDHVDGVVLEDQPGFRDRSVRIPSADVVLDGDLSVPPRAFGMVCFAHGSGSGRHSERNRFVARELQKAGIGTLLLDLLTQEEESIDVRTGHLRFDIALLADRLIAASDWLAHYGATRRLPIGYFGASTGGGAALVAAAWRPNIRAVVSRGGRPDLAGEALKRVRCPVSLIVGAYDAQVIELNELALDKLRAEKELIVVPRATHLFPEPGALEQVAKIAERWFSRWLPFAPGASPSA